MRVTQLFLSRTDHVGTGEYRERKLRHHSPGLRITGDRDDRDYEKVIPVMVEITCMGITINLLQFIRYSAISSHIVTGCTSGSAPPKFPSFQGNQLTIHTTKYFVLCKYFVSSTL